MNESILIIGPPNLTQNKTLELLDNWKIKKIQNNPDIHEITRIDGKKNISLDQVKEGIKFLRNKPFQENHKILLIHQAELLNAESQNALLKTLEEPPTYAKIILTVENQHNLLETVLSRCKKFSAVENSGQGVTQENINEFNEFLALDLGQKLLWAAEESKKEKDEVLEDLKTMIGAARSQITTNEVAASSLEHLNSVYMDLYKTNVNTRLSLEKLCFDIDL